MGKYKKEKQRNQLEPHTEPDQDDGFYFIAGYTPGGVPYGVTWEEMGLEPWQVPEVDAIQSDYSELPFD